jgi:hypothetical protein
VVVLAFYLRPIRALGATRSAVSRTTTTG